MVYMTVYGAEAVQVALGVHPLNKNVTRKTYGYCCDSGHYQSERESDREDIYWTILNFQSDNERELSATYETTGPTNRVNYGKPLMIEIADLAGGESTNYRFHVEPMGGN